MKSFRQHYITKTFLYNIDSFKPHFYVVKRGLTGVYIIFLISTQKYKLWVLVRTTIYVLSKNMKNIRIFIWQLSGFGGKIFNILNLNRRVFEMENKYLGIRVFLEFFLYFYENVCCVYSLESPHRGIIEAILMSTFNRPLFYKDRKYIHILFPFVSKPGTMITYNPQWFEFPISRTNFHGPKDVWAIEVRLFIYKMLICQTYDFLEKHGFLKFEILVISHSAISVDFFFIDCLKSSHSIQTSIGSCSRDYHWSM